MEADRLQLHLRKVQVINYACDLDLTAFVDLLVLENVNPKSFIRLTGSYYNNLYYIF